MKFEFDPTGVPAVGIRFIPDVKSPGEPAVVVTAIGIESAREVQELLSDISDALKEALPSPEALTDQQASVEPEPLSEEVLRGYDPVDRELFKTAAEEMTHDQRALSGIEVREHRSTTPRPRFNPQPGRRR